MNSNCKEFVSECPRGGEGAIGIVILAAVDFIHAIFSLHSSSCFEDGEQ